MYNRNVKRIPIVQIGVGGVGRSLVEQVLRANEGAAARDGFRFDYVALADSRSQVHGDPVLDPTTLRNLLADKAHGRSLSNQTPQSAWLSHLGDAPTLIIDVSGSDTTAPLLVEAIERGHAVVLANKKPLAADGTHFHNLTRGGRTRYEATVGAGLPVISTLQSVLDTGDVVHEIAGCFSGTLGFVFSELERGTSFSAAVREAAARGWTEPDPRDDLNGMDVGRKALILARTLGLELELVALTVEPLFTATLAQLPKDQFIAALPEIDQSMAERVAQAQQSGNTLRYVATVNRDAVTVGVRAVPQASALGGLQGPDNLISFSTDRYEDQPLVVRGPGAGTERTAAGVLGDMLMLARQVW